MGYHGQREVRWQPIALWGVGLGFKFLYIHCAMWGRFSGAEKPIFVGSLYQKPAVKWFMYKPTVKITNRP